MKYNILNVHIVNVNGKLNINVNIMEASTHK